MDMPTLLHTTSNIGLLCNMTIGRGAVGKFDQTQAAQVSRLVVGGKGTGKQGLGVEHFQIIEMRLTVLVTQCCHVGLVIDHDGEMHNCLRMPFCKWNGMVASTFDLLYPGYGLEMRTGCQHITQTMVLAMHSSHRGVSQQFALAAASQF